jgi:hypothetical protein
MLNPSSNHFAAIQCNSRQHAQPAGLDSESGRSRPRVSDGILPKQQDAHGAHVRPADGRLCAARRDVPVAFWLPDGRRILL